MKPILFILFIVFSCAASAQELGINTTRFVGGDSSCGAMGNSYAISTRDGGVLFFGSTTCYSGGGDIPTNFPDSAGSLGGNVLVGKLDSNLDVVWVKGYGGSQIDLAKSAVQTTDGGYAVLAYTQSVDRDVTGNHAYGTGDVWLIRLDSMGNLLWQKCYGSIYDEQPGAIAATPDKGFIFFGVSNGEGGDVPVHYSGSEFDYDWFVVKTDSSGTTQWTKTIGGVGDEDWGGSILYANNSYYFISSSTSTDHDCTDTIWCTGHTSGYNYYIFNLDALGGNILWDSSYGGSRDELACQAVWDIRDSTLVINGYTTSSDYMVTGYHGGVADYWVIKVDRNGVLKWEKCLGSSNDDEGSSIALMNTGYIVYGGTNPGSIGQQDSWVFALDSSGNELANNIFGGTRYEFPNSVLPYKNGFVCAGTTNSSNFTVGDNIGHLPGLVGETYFSYINYWPLNTPSVNKENQRLIVYPNPTNGIVKIQIPGTIGELTIVNSVGSTIYQENTDGSGYVSNIYTDDWLRGMYVIKWQGADGDVLVEKLIVD